jgi:energy-coupling factor transporter ATP-binding protein EcfA2
MSGKFTFPEGLLDRSVDERVNFFRSQLVLHAHFRDALDALHLEITVAEPNTVIFLIGPPGVGKTTLYHVLEREIWEQYRKEMEVDRGFMPACGIQAMEGDSQRFSWRDYRCRFLLKLDPVAIDRKLPMSPDDWKKTHKSVVPPASALGRGDLRYSFEQAVKRRKVKVLLIDDADAIAKASSGRRQLSQLEVTKSEADIVEVPHVMFGTYDLWKFREGISNHLTRRTVDVHFGRYRIDRQRDYETFTRVVRAFRRRLPLREPPDLDPCMDFLYERTNGCVGSLCVLLRKALHHALTEGKETITLAHLQRHALAVNKCISLSTEAAAMEKEFDESSDKTAELRKMLGLKPLPSPAPLPKPEAHGNGHKPGVRSPFRDPIGLHRSTAETEVKGA